MIKQKDLHTEEGGGAIAVDIGGNVYVTGCITTGVYPNTDYATIKYNNLGATMWLRRYHGSDSTGQDEATALAIDNSGNIYVTGKSYNSGSNYDYLTIKYDSLGDTIWVRTYNGPGNGFDVARGVAVDNDGNVYVTGRSYDTTTGEDYAVVKYNNSGGEEWVQRYNGPMNNEDDAYAIAVDNKGYVYVTGASSGLISYECATIKYSTVGIEETDARSKMQDARLEVYPNPFVQTTSLKFNVQGSTFKDKITIYDISGKLVDKTTDNIIGKKLKAGIYFVKIKGYKPIKITKIK